VNLQWLNESKRRLALIIVVEESQLCPKAIRRCITMAEEEFRTAKKTCEEQSSKSQLQWI